jgi:uncharacterized caspase-like protein
MRRAIGILPEMASLCVTSVESASSRILQKDCPNGPKSGYPEACRGLVIGVAEYDGRPELALPNSARDVKEVSSVLCELGFHLTSAVNSDKGEIERLLKEFGSKNRPGETRLFYFSGHGVQQDESNYVVPAIFNPEAISDSAIELATVLDSMADGHERGPRSQKIIILDACRDNRLGVTKGLTLPRDAPQDSWWIAFATAP